MKTQENQNTKKLNIGESIRLHKLNHIALTKVEAKEYLLIDVRTNKAMRFKEASPYLTSVVGTAFRLINNGVLSNG